MNLNLCLFYFTYILNLLNCIPNLLASPILGGQEDTSHSYKYHVSVRYRHNPAIPNSGEHLCGGTIIDVKYVLSAAQCYLKLNKGWILKRLYPRSDGIAVLSGTSVTRGPGIITEVDQIFIPKEYNTQTPFHADISVLKLRDSLDVVGNSAILGILKIDDGSHPPDFYGNKDVLILGNGYDAEGIKRTVPAFAKKRQFLLIHMQPRNLCPHFDYTICAKNIDNSCHRTGCIGDSGSPLVFGDKVIGVFNGIIHEKYRGEIQSTYLATRVLPFRNFIHNAMSEGGNRSDMYYF